MSGSPLLVGLIGAGIGLSRTPAMHEGEARRLGLPLSYRLIDTDRLPRGEADLATLLRAAELMGFRGVNVTFPFKIAALAHVDALSEDARRVGALNTIVLREGRRVGDNTDLWGFGASLAEGLADADLSCVLVIGAGGAGTAVAHALVDRGARALVLAEPERARAEALRDRLAANHPEVPVTLVADAQAGLREGVTGLVNASPVGMAKTPGSPVPAALLRPDLFVADVVYFPLETRLLADARAAGCRTLSGAGMAVHQAARAFALFTGRDADPARLRETFEAFDSVPGGAPA
ncbi:shikimate dehydrogenase [Salinarimonas sp.]|uniref:shikimate dehydrogenase n=1 Tax=Salinarimonas sp. TaxID=2766526 RepID=UPI0032D94455